MPRNDLLARIERLERLIDTRVLTPPRCACQFPPLLGTCDVCRDYWERTSAGFDWDALLRRPADLPDPADEA